MRVGKMKLAPSSGLALTCIGVGILALSAFCGHMLGAYVHGLMDLQHLAREALMQDGLILIVVLAYIVLIAFPFVPGAEIGFALLLIFGAPIAGVLYLATVTALVLSFSVGRIIPFHVLENILLRLGSDHTARRLSEILRKEHCIADSLPISMQGDKQRFYRFVSWLIRHRLYTLAALINTPGNTAIGGGGGIALVAGVSRQISFREFLVCISLAVAPVPVIVTIAAWVGG